MIAPTAIDRAAVTLELGPYAVVNNGKAIAEEFGKPTVSARTEASDRHFEAFSSPDSDRYDSGARRTEVLTLALYK